ncbi:hypothetical protein Droror1_Dr00016455 [Drosera rotundifolia]
MVSGLLIIRCIGGGTEGIDMGCWRFVEFTGYRGFFCSGATSSGPFPTKGDGGLESLAVGEINRVVAAMERRWLIGGALLISSSSRKVRAVGEGAAVGHLD